MWVTFVLPRVLVVGALAAGSMMPASAGILGLTRGQPPVQTAGVKVPLKLIQVGRDGGYDDPAEPPATEGCPDCWEPPGGSDGEDGNERPDDPPTSP